MTAEELVFYISGLAFLALIPLYLRVLQAKLEITRARTFLRWKLNLRVWRFLALSGFSGLTVGLVASLTWPEDLVLRFFVPYGLLLIFIFVVLVAYARLVIAVVRGSGPGKT